MKNNTRCSRLQLFFAAVFLLGIATSANAAQVNLIINGGFEGPVLAPLDLYQHRVANQLTGWSVVSSYIGVVQFNNLYDLASEGSQAVQFETLGDRISQSFATVTGQSYTLAFDLYRYRGSVTSGWPTLGVTVGNINNATFVGNGSAGYVTNTLQFMAVSSITALTFTYPWNSPGPFPELDNVSVSSPAAVPIPAAFWLFGSGLIGLLGFLRKP